MSNLNQKVNLIGKILLLNVKVDNLKTRIQFYDSNKSDKTQHDEVRYELDKVWLKLISERCDVLEELEKAIQNETKESDGV